MGFRGTSAICAVVACAVVAMLPAPASAAVEPVFEKYAVPTVDGAEINVEVMRPKGEPDAPVILTYSPYNTLYEPSANLADDELGNRYLERGYARAVADVLGTRNSSGCWDYGGPKETQSGVDLVNFLAGQRWSNGRVAMIGGSYDGTTATMVASRGDAAPGLKAIVPIAGINHWYGYAYGGGIRYAGNTERPTDEGIDTPLAFDFGLVRTPPTDPSDPDFVDIALSRANPCDSVAHTEAGYDDSPDYNDFWIERDYRRHAADFRAAMLVAHGWQDYNVKQEEGVELYESVPEDDPATQATVEGVPFKRLYMFQDGHGSPSDPNWEPLLDRFFDRTLKGVANGIGAEPPVLTEGRSAGEESTGFRSEPEWPPPSTGRVDFFLGRGPDGGELTRAPAASAGSAAYTDTATVTEEASEAAPDAEANWLFYETEPLAAGARMAGAATLELTLSADRDHAHLTPVLVDVARDGTTRTVSRGFLNLLYRDSLTTAEPLPVGEPVAARVEFKPQDQSFDAGHRIGVLVQSSNTAWALPDDPGATLTVEHGGPLGSRLSVPLVGAGSDTDSDGGPGDGQGGPGEAGGGPGGDSGGGRCSSTVRGSKRSDRLQGTAASDRISGRRGGDRISGGRGGDCVRGGRGEDAIGGGAGDDEIRGGRGRDRIRGGAGDDVIRAARGARDRIDCGPGHDRAFVDAGRDRVGRSCEQLRRR